ncbi:hypothetical protein MIND_00904400 [Mycena indigotica]|uniref:F-box domain-containing protein n=1 Tax=Mycena indigotica TaxID=2126181 RepID=A0A8H6SD42_9AGAR|nr:uncharacterized protein MIND_00904400 [Mycena indigotica]KAF7296738.1 hypothetical protein MIND_00904400 [Mycena indigotica]
MVSSLAPELIEIVVNNIEHADTLKSCSLVANVFRYPSQRQLWRHVTIEYTEVIDYNTPAAADFSRQGDVATHLQAFPHLARYVVSFVLTTGAIGIWQWEPISRRLAALFELLSNVGSLTITSTDMFAWDLEQSSLIRYTTAVERLIRNQAANRTLRYLELGGFSYIPPAFMVRILTACPTVSIVGLELVPEDLERASVTSSHSAALEVSKNDRPCQMTALRVGIFDISHQRMHKSLIPHVKSLCALVLTADFPNDVWYELPMTRTSRVYELCAAARGTLVNLSIELPPQDNDDVITSFSIPNLPRLQCLEINFSNVLLDIGDHTDNSISLTPPPRLLDLLSTSLVNGAFPSLRQLCFLPGIYPPRIIRWDSAEFPPGFKCAAWDAILADYLSANPNVASFCVPRFYRPCDDPDHPYFDRETIPMRSRDYVRLFQEYSQAMDTALPNATARGLKVVEYPAGTCYDDDEVDFFQRKQK